MSGSQQNTQWIRQGSLIVSKTISPTASTEPALDLSQLRFTFRIRQQDAQSLSNAEVRVYNIDQPTASAIQNEYTRVVIQAGYQNAATGVIFDGTIVQTRRGRERNVDTYLDILASEGNVPYQFAVISQTLAPGASVQDRINALNTALQPYNTEIVSGNLVGGVLPRGKTLFGLALGHLDQITKTTGSTWVIQNGKIQVVPLTGYLPGEAVVLNSQTGLRLIGQAEATQDGVRATCLINPKVRLGGRVQINNADVNAVLNRTAPVPFDPTNPFTGFFADVTADGFYRVIVIEYEGDTRGLPWYQTLTCLAIDPSAPPAQSVPLYLGGPGQQSN